MAKKRKSSRKKIDSRKSNNNAKGVKVYKVNGTARRETRARRGKGLQTFLIVLIIILAIAAIFSAIQTFFPDLFGKYTLQGELAAKVNGAPITMQRLNTEYDRLPLQYKYFITKEDFLTQLIDETLMLQEASKQGLGATKEQIDLRIELFMQESNITSEQLDEVLKEKNIKYPELREMIANQLIIDMLLKKAVKDKINVTSDLILQYYNENSDTFRIPELAVVRHILIGTDNRTVEKAEERAEMVFDLVKNDTIRFCSYVWLYTDDEGSAENCGEYTFPRGQMVEEFENLAFAQDINEINIVQTDFGFHILQTLNKSPEQLIPFKDVEEQISIILEGQQEKMLSSEFVVSLREQADIINYMQNSEEETTEGAEEEESEIIVEEPVVEEEVVEEEPMEEPEEIEEIEEEIVEQQESEIPEGSIGTEQEELEEEVPEVIEEVVEEEPVIPPEEMEFADCLTAKGVVLYGAYWDSSTKTQKDQFGANIADIEYVECGVQGDFRAQQQECTDAGILAYPTWVIDKVKHMGIMSLEQLASLTGCAQ